MQTATPKVESLPSETPTPTTTPTEVPTQTPSPEPSPTSTASLTVTLTNTATPEPSATPTFTATPEITGSIPEKAIMLYFIAPETGGPVACGDSLIPSYSGLVKTGDFKKDLSSALNRLFAIGTQRTGNLYNALYQSKLKVKTIDYSKYNNTATIYMTGSFVKPKTDCDQLRYRAQVWSTAKQFGVKIITIWLDNGKLLGDLLAANDK